MDAVAIIDPVEALLNACEGRFEWTSGSLVEMAPPSQDHIRKSWFIATLLEHYCEERGVGRAIADGYAQRLDRDTVRVPDAAFFRKEHEDRMGPTFSEGAADLVVEIVSTESKVRDRGDKFYEYERAGVEEYWIVDPIRRSADFFRLQDGVYRPVLPDPDGRLHSSAVEGFWIRVEWLWNPPKLNDAQRELGLI